MNTYSKDTRDFLHYLRGRAAIIRNTAGQQGCMDDGGAQKLENQIIVYEAGLNHKLPSIWDDHYAKYLNQKEDYELYLKLRQRFEGK